MAWSVDPWTLGSPRRALMPPPQTPMLPSSNWMIDIARMIWLPVVWWVQPRA